MMRTPMIGLGPLLILWTAAGLAGCTGGTGLDDPGQASDSGLEGASDANQEVASDAPPASTDITADAPQDTMSDAAAVDAPDPLPSSGLLVVPERLRFETVDVGCHSRTQQACVVNPGPDAVRWAGFAFEGCDRPAFRALNPKDLPALLPAGEHVCVDIGFGPQEAGEWACDAVALAGDGDPVPVGKVRLEAKGDPGLLVVDEFVQIAGQTLDILLVIDDSPSMCVFADSIRQQLGEIALHGSFWDDDFHLGVLVATLDPERTGRLNGGQPDVSPRYLASKQGTGQDLVRLGGLPGCAGTPDGEESAMTSLQTFFKGELHVDYAVGCATDADCAREVCLDPQQCTVRCLEGGCRGANAGFYRDDAQLEIVIVTDGDDHGPDTAQWHIDFLKNIKGYYNINMMHVNAVLLPMGGCAEPGQATFDDDNVYWQAADQTGGLIGSLCQSWGSILNRIGGMSFHVKVQFFLKKLAQPGTIRVFVNDVQCITGWLYDPPSNSVIFDQDGTCVPEPGQRIRVEYRAWCLTE